MYNEITPAGMAYLSAADNQGLEGRTVYLYPKFPDIYSYNELQLLPTIDLDASPTSVEFLQFVSDDGFKCVIRDSYDSEPRVVESQYIRFWKPNTSETLTEKVDRMIEEASNRLSKYIDGLHKPHSYVDDFLFNYLSLGIHYPDTLKINIMPFDL